MSFYDYGGSEIYSQLRSLLADRKSTRYTWLLVILLVLAYILNNRFFGPKMGGYLGNYILPMLMWGLIIGVIYLIPRVKKRGKLRMSRTVRWLALMCAFISVLGMMLQGAIGGFGRSPYDHSWTGLLTNAASLGIALVGMELARAWLINRHFTRRPILGLTIVSIFFAIITTPLNKWTGISFNLMFAQFVGSDLCPTVGQNVLATYLASLGGPIPAIIYRGSLILLERLSPVLPNSNWASQTLLGILAPILGIILVRQIYSEENRENKARTREEGIASWLLTGLASIVIIWFAMGVFTYAPRVILSGSMEPEIKTGDVVIIHKIAGKDARVGDIILFPYEKDMKVTHRIIAASDQQGAKLFTTKGDANPEPDSNLVPEDNVQGKVVSVIPKIGWLTLVFRGAVK
ncbi:MAG: signal peptidase I [Syntrophomonas sp.]